jgi:peptidoglycan/LPS O-acetylase OafA/YrhL
VTTTVQLQTHQVARKESRRVIQLDFVRGIAILLVLQFHFSTLSATPPTSIGIFFERTGWMGVDLFFVLSGFLVGGLLVKELLDKGSIDIPRFLMRRALKIWPAYYFYLIVQIVARRHPLGSFLWQNALNIQNYVGTSLLHTWSLAVEEHFYLLLPGVLVLAYRSRRLRPHLGFVLVLVCVLVTCGRIAEAIVHGPGRWQLQTHARLDELLLGVLLSYLFYTDPQRLMKVARRRVLLGALTIAAFVIAYLSGKDSYYMATMGYSTNAVCFGAFVLLMYGYQGAITGTLAYKAIAWIGQYSYGIYLWHLAVREPVSQLCYRLPTRLQGSATFVCEYAAAICAGIVLSKAIEIPVLRLRDKWVPRRKVHADVRTVQPADTGISIGVPMAETPTYSQ